MAAKLDIARIVTEAIALMEEEEGGLESLSLRKLAARLGVRAPSLYRYVESKDQLFLLMSASIFRQCIERMPPCRSWQGWLFEFGLSLWTEQHRTPGTLQLIAHNRAWVRTQRPHHEEVVRTLAALGLSLDHAAVAQASVQAMVTGWTTMFPITSAEDETAFRTSLRVLVDGWADRVGSPALAD